MSLQRIFFVFKPFFSVFKSLLSVAEEYKCVVSKGS